MIRRTPPPRAYPIADYPIFTAEIASTANEALLLGPRLEIARAGDEKLHHLGFAHVTSVGLGTG